MVSEAEVRDALRHVIDPELHTDIVDLGMVDEIIIRDTTVQVGIALTIASCPMRGQIESDVERRVGALDGVDHVEIVTGVMSQEQRSTLMERARMNARENATPTAISPSTRVVAVSSGKGGVGKSSLSVNLALAISAQGHSVGLLDADIWGFSAPRMLGANDTRLSANEQRKILPTEAMGIHLVSTGLLLEDEDTALMWRGLMLTKAVEQFLNDVAWPSDLGYLIIDMPPGTGDVALTLSQVVGLAGAVVVCTPQQVALLDVVKAIGMFRQVKIPVLGMVENMSGDIFGSGGARAKADDMGVPFLGEVPAIADIRERGDAGRIATLFDEDSPARDPLLHICGRTAIEVARQVIDQPTMPELEIL